MNGKSKQSISQAILSRESQRRGLEHIEQGVSMSDVKQVMTLSLTFDYNELSPAAPADYVCHRNIIYHVLLGWSSCEYSDQLGQGQVLGSNLAPLSFFLSRFLFAVSVSCLLRRGTLCTGFVSTCSFFGPLSVPRCSALRLHLELQKPRLCFLCPFSLPLTLLWVNRSLLV